MVPKVFISSTQEDLRDYRDAAKDAALTCGFLPVMSEYWPASGERVPLEACLKRVVECDLAVVIVAHRYGWVPPGQPEGEHKSITRMECERALETGREVAAFLLDEEAPWPLELREEYAAVTAIKKGVPSAEELTFIHRSLEELGNFRAFLHGRGIRARFKSPADLRGEVIAALNDWQLRHNRGTPSESLKYEADPTRLLRSLFEATRYIDIRGLQVGSARAHQFPIEELYIPLNLKGDAAGKTSSQPGQDEQLRALLRRPRVVITGDPGSGKTTLLRRVTQTLARAWLGMDREQLASQLGFEGEPPLPLFIRLSDLGKFLERGRPADVDAPASDDSPEWLICFLTKLARENAWGLGQDFFVQQLTGGACILLLDGLDEAHSERNRKLLSRLIGRCAAAYERCRFIITSRPKAYAGETILIGFDRVNVEALTEDSIRVFLRRWCDEVFRETPSAGERHLAGLLEALDARPEIRRMATNPVMLTALAVVHWNEKRIPDQRSELYESIIRWLSRAREDRQGRIPAERCIRLLQTVAFAMQNHPEGRQVEAGRRWAAECLADYFNNEGPQAVEAAEQFLAEEELDSGIIVARGPNIRFWHLSFQEFLAARAVASLREKDQREVLVGQRAKLVSPEWRETVLLFSGILHSQGPQKLYAMLEAVLANESPQSSLSRQAQTVGLLGAIQQDLSSIHFRFQHPLYDEMLARVTQIFDSSAISSVPIEVRLEAADALGQAGDPRLERSNWVPIPAGAFRSGVQAEDPDTPGYDPCALPGDGPVAEIRLGAFEILRFPVTVQDFERFLSDGGYQQPEFWVPEAYGRWDRPQDWDVQIQYPSRPVVGVSWYEAMAYCRWRGDTAQLPSESQWERAARGAEGRLFPWGNEPPDPTRLNYTAAGHTVGRATPVGFYPAGATPEGLLDLAGNVFEWCLDRCPNQETARTVRGGSYQSVELFVRAAFRGRYPAESRKDFIGFRVCRIGTTPRAH